MEAYKNSFGKNRRRRCSPDSNAYTTCYSLTLKNVNVFELSVNCKEATLLNVSLGNHSRNSRQRKEWSTEAAFQSNSINQLNNHLYYFRNSYTQVGHLPYTLFKAQSD